MQLQALCGSNDNRQFRFQAGFAAFDVEELLSTQVGTETSLRNHVIAVGKRHLCRDDRVTAVGDVGERAAMHESRGIFCCLHQVRQKGVFQQYGDRSSNPQVIDCERLIVVCISQQDITDAAFQVFQIGRQTKDSHHFGSRRDVESCLCRNTVCRTSQAGYDIAQATVVYVEHAFPFDLFQPFAGVACLIDIIIQQRCDHVVGRCNRVEIAGEMQVDVFHRQYLCVSASGCSALHSETRTQRGFTQGGDCFFTYLVQAQGQTDRYGCFTDTCFGRRDGRYQDQVMFFDFLFIDQVKGHFGDIPTIVLYFFARNTQTCGNFLYFAKGDFSCNFYIRFHVLM